MEFLERVIFASDAELLALWGVGLLMVAGFATLMERRRMKRARIDRVGWVPWFSLFFVSVIIGGGLLALAIPGMMQG
ncbi:hypothetical protein ACXYL9_11350 [Qipengyuania sp. CAU 1752]